MRTNGKVGTVHVASEGRETVDTPPRGHQECRRGQQRWRAPGGKGPECLLPIVATASDELPISTMGSIEGAGPSK